METQALFMAICENGRELHSRAPTSLRNLWPCFRASWTDGDENCEILVRLQNDGPLQDRDSFHPPMNRASYFERYQKRLDNSGFTTISQIMTLMQDAILGEDEEGLITQAFKKVLKERDSAVDLFGLDKRRLEWLSTASVEEILSAISVNDQLSNRNKVVRMMTEFSAQDSICVVDGKGFILPLGVENDRVVPGAPPAWLNDMTVRRAGRTIAHGNTNLNHLVDRTSYRRNNWAQNKFQKIENTRFRRESNQRRKSITDARKDRSGNN